MITTDQLKKLHVLLNQLGLMDEKVNFVYTASNGRATSSKDLTVMEAKSIIEHLSRYDGNDRMRKKIFALAYEAGIIYGDSPADKKMNAAKLDSFLKERGTIKKSLNQLSKDELIKTVNQFEQIKKHADENKAGRATKNVLAELGISTAGKQPLKSI
jgi:hypothetical protein